MGHVVIKLPDVGEGTAQAELTGWLVKVGDMVSEDQNLAEITTDKATVEIPSPAAGRVKALHGEPGDIIAVGTRLIELETESSVEAPKSEDHPKKTASRTETPKKDEQPIKPTTKVLASPAVRARAKQLRLALEDVVGSGAGGRVLHKDLDSYLIYRQREHGAPLKPPHAALPSTGTEDIKIIGIRRKIAERMQESKRHIPHYSYVEEVDVTAVEELRLHLIKERGTKLSILPFVIQALCRAVSDFPQVNAHYDDAAGILHQFRVVHAGIATQTDKGLMVPVIFNAEALDVWSLSAEIARVAEAARTGTADRKELTGSTITITSLGRLGGIVTTPVINRPEVAIIGINKVTQRPVVRDGSSVVVRSMMNLSSSFDHRIVDGSVAAELIQRMKAMLEQPAMLFMPGGRA
jgi:2-oxoisovalerate dehydrogenase E2 component (dihydrolipoyl transacylase)